MNEACEFPPEWLSQSLIQINRLREDSCIDQAMNQMARRVVRSIEMDEMPTPRIFRAHDRCIHMHFRTNKGFANISINEENRVWVLAKTPDFEVDMPLKTFWLSWLREIIVCVFPSGQQTTQEQMFSLAEISRS